MAKWWVGSLVTFLMFAQCVADENPLSVHVLNTTTGLPSANVEVSLDHRVNGRWMEITHAVTDENGRVKQLYPAQQSMPPGVYRVTFKIGEWFEKRGETTFFPEASIVFNADGRLPHYHIPLLISPYGYTTYRGN